MSPRTGSVSYLTFAAGSSLLVYTAFVYPLLGLVALALLHPPTTRQQVELWLGLLPPAWLIARLFDRDGAQQLYHDTVQPVRRQPSSWSTP